MHVAAGPGVRLPSIDGLSAFEVAARLGSFERAAHELHVTASAVSKRVATLEDLIGGQLLTRGSKSLTLTTLGKEYLEQVRQVLDLLASMPQHQRHVQRTERLILSLLPTFARKLLMPRLYEYSLAHPQVDLEVVTSIPYLDVAGLEAHLDVRHGNPESQGASPLMDELVLPVASAELVDKLQIKTPSDLASAPIIRCPLEPWGPWWSACGMEATEPQQGPRFVDVGLMYEAALQGHGIALARPSLIREWLQSGQLRAVYPMAVRTRQQYYVAFPPRSATASVFTAWLQGVCEEAADEGLKIAAACSGPDFRLA